AARQRPGARRHLQSAVAARADPCRRRYRHRRAGQDRARRRCPRQAAALNTMTTEPGRIERQYAKPAHRLPYHSATAMPADTAAVTKGSAHCGGKCEGWAKTSPIRVTTALIVAWRPTLFVVRSICSRSATVTIAPTVPQTVARYRCSGLNAAKMLPRAMTSRQASHAPANFSAAGRKSPPARQSANARVPSFKVAIKPSLVRRRFGALPMCDNRPVSANHFHVARGSLLGDVRLIGRPSFSGKPATVLVFMPGKSIDQPRYGAINA